MALSQSALLEVLEALKASDSTDVIRQALEVMLQQLIDAEATAFIGAEPHERTDARVTQRNGTRSKTITTTAGDLDLSITKLRTGIVLPVVAGASPPDRSGVVRGDHGGLRDRHVGPQGRRPRQGAGCRHRDQQVRGLSDLRRAGRGGRLLRWLLDGPQRYGDLQRDLECRRTCSRPACANSRRPAFCPVSLSATTPVPTC